MNKIQREDIQDFVSLFPLRELLHNRTILITGATGLIGSNLVHCLLALDCKIKVVAPIRDLKKAARIFSQNELKNIRLIECDIVSYNYDALCDIDFIIHCAAPTASKYFIEHPVETFDVIYSGTKVLLNYARKRQIKGFVYLSSLEVYGEIYDESNPVFEESQGYLDVMAVRSSYPMAKRAAENLCCLYAAEYGVPVMVARLTQTTGPGIALNDNRVIAQFARLAAYGNDIVLHTTGESARPYCYTIDAISAIIFILLKGNPGEAYNVANEDTYISAKDMAEFVRVNFNPSITVRVELNDNMGYAPVTKLRLSTKKLMMLGWKPKYNLSCIFSRLIEYLRE